MEKTRLLDLPVNDDLQSEVPEETIDALLPETDLLIAGRAADRRRRRAI